uniref:Uncharacterized protein n=1 Tax=Avena sativa TaxID=4498 RepID=A0ACD5YN52_AVESA
MAIHIPPPSKWSHKHIILVTLIGTMIAITMVAVISISLAPAHILVSITDAKASSAGQGVDATQLYTFTLVANNSSPRMAVQYGALNAEIWYSETAWVPAVVKMDDKIRRQAPGNVTHFNVSAEYWQSEQASSNEAGGATRPPSPAGAGAAADNSTSWSNCTVVVMAQVWFKAGSGISTRSYNIKASCSQVNFRNNATTAIVDCTHG